MKTIGILLGILICAVGAIFLFSGFLQGCFQEWPGKYDNPGGDKIWWGIMLFAAGSWIFRKAKG